MDYKMHIHPTYLLDDKTLKFMLFTEKLKKRLQKFKGKSIL